MCIWSSRGSIQPSQGGAPQKTLFQAIYIPRNLCCGNNSTDFSLIQSHLFTVSLSVFFILTLGLNVSFKLLNTVEKNNMVQDDSVKE